MCDELTAKDAEEYLRQEAMTRREFSKRGAGVALAMMLPAVANALDVVEQDVMVETPDGMADCYFVHPASGSHAAVIVWPDIVSIRPAFRAMGKRLAESGYSVLVVNPYYRTVKGAVVPEGKTFRDPGIRDLLMPHARTLSPETCVSDGRAFVEYLDKQAIRRYQSQDRYDRLLHDWFLHDAAGCSDSESHWRGRIVPRRWPGDGRGRQPAFAGFEDESRVFDRDCCERRRTRSRSESAFARGF